MKSVPDCAADYREVVRGYLAKRQLYPFQIADPVPDELGLVVVIPCLAEPDLTRTLDSLASCDQPRAAVEVIVVVNHSTAADAAVRERNAATLAEAQDWCQRAQPFWRLHLVNYPDLPAKHAGVGQARKLGLDEASERLALSATGRGVLVFLDADCVVASHYLVAIEQFYADHPDTGAATVEFEHPVQGAGNGLAIAQYELHLRYYVQALRYAGLPGVTHTVGSCLTVRSEVYAGQGGMNRRQAGEDYYFVQKLVAAVPVAEINTTRVYPSARISWRVPFGTGKAMADNADLNLVTYAPQIFADLARWIDCVPNLYQADGDGWLLELPESLQTWLIDNDIHQRLAEVRRNTATAKAFQVRLFRWFNAFRCLKYVHFASAGDYPRVPVEGAAATLLQWQEIACPEPASAFSLLEIYRCVQAVGDDLAGARQPWLISQSAGGRSE